MRNTILNNEAFTYYTDRDGLGDIIQKSNATEMNLFEYRGDKKLKHFTLIKNNETTHVSYFYDALGRRIAKQVQTPTENFTNTFAHEAGQDKILIGKNGLNQETLYVDGQGIDEHFAQVNSSAVKGYVADYLGTILNSSAVGSSKVTGAFGEILDTISTISSSTEPVSYGFTGQELDLESKTNFYNSRQYDQDAGKFNSQDMIGFDGGDYNLGRYVFNRPLRLTDSSGNTVIDLTGELTSQIINSDVYRELHENKSITVYITRADFIYADNGKQAYGTSTKTSDISTLIRVSAFLNKTTQEVTETIIHELQHSFDQLMGDYREHDPSFYRDVSRINSGGLRCPEF